MTLLDWTIVALVALLARAGAARGFIAGALWLAGFVGGAALGARIGAALAAGGSSSPYAPLFGLCGGLLLGVLLGFGLGRIGERVRGRLRLRAVRRLDSALGAAMNAVLALAIAWLAGATALQTPGARDLRAEVQRSRVLRELNGILPPSGPILGALARFDPFPSIAGPAFQVPPPTAAIARDRDVRAAAASVVRVLGSACGLGVEGSGWVAGAALVVTNAHVVAGQTDTVVQVGGRAPSMRAQVVRFDPENDVAVLRVDGLAAPALRLATRPRAGASGAILGYPNDGPYRVRPARLGPTVSTISVDAYGRGPVRRSITTLRGLLRPGNSGGPVVGADGRVLTTVFATARRGRDRGLGVPNDRVRRALDGAGAPVSTGPCVR